MELKNVLIWSHNCAICHKKMKSYVKRGIYLWIGKYILVFLVI